MTVARDEALMPPERAVLHAGDTISVLGPASSVPTLARLFSTPERAPVWQQVPHDFVLSGDALLRDVAGLYGTRDLTPSEYPSTLEAAMLNAFATPPVEGDAVEIAGLTLTAARMEDGRILQVGLRLPRQA